MSTSDYITQVHNLKNHLIEDDLFWGSAMEAQLCSELFNNGQSVVSGTLLGALLVRVALVRIRRAVYALRGWL